MPAVFWSSSQEQRLVPLLALSAGGGEHPAPLELRDRTPRVQVLRGKAGSEAIALHLYWGQTKPQRPFFSRAMTTV